MDVFRLCQLFDLVYWKVVLDSINLDHFVIYKEFCWRCIPRYVNISCQGVAFCDPTFRYGNNVNLHFEETEKKF